MLVVSKESRNQSIIAGEKLMIDVSYVHKPDRTQKINIGFLFWIKLQSLNPYSS
jgi:hypothetical protein